MTRNEILAAPSMPVFAPSHPYGPFRFVEREHQIVDSVLPDGRVLHGYLA